MYSSTSIPTPPFYSTETAQASSEDYSLHLFPSEFGSRLDNPLEISSKKQFPYPLPTPPKVSVVSTHLRRSTAGSMDRHSVPEYHHNPRPLESSSGTSRIMDFSQLDPWYSCIYNAEFEEPAIPPVTSRPTLHDSTTTSAYPSPLTLSLPTNVSGLLGVGPSYHTGFGPDSGIQVTSNTQTTLSTPRFSNAPSSAGGINIIHGGTPGMTAGSTPQMFPSSHSPSAVGDATDTWEVLRQQHQPQQYPPISSRPHHSIERAATFDASSWRLAYPDVNIVQPTPINTTASHLWPDILKHRTTGISDAALTGRDADMNSSSRENKRLRLSASPSFSGSEYNSGSEDETTSMHAPLYSNSNSPQMGKSVPGPSNSQGGAEYAAPPPKARKGRRKLGAEERKEVHELRKMGACTRCWGLKMKCGEGSPCPRCFKLGGTQQCVRVHFVDLDVFSRWLNDAYSRSMMHNNVTWLPENASRTIHVSHEVNGPQLPIRVNEFIPLLPNQLDYWYKGECGWRSVPTTPFATKKGGGEDLDKYIEAHIDWYVENHFRDNNQILHETFRVARKYANDNLKDNQIVKDTLKLWTMHQLLLKGATITGADTLGINPIVDPTSSLNGKVPMPRVLSNQLDHLLERRIWQAERQLLTDLQRRILSRKREEWLRIYFCLTIFLNVLERDSWRLYYWLKHGGNGYVWRHPISPNQLIEKNIRLADSLGAHFQAISKGLTPFALDWTKEQTMGLLSSDNEIVEYVKNTGKLIRDPNTVPKRRNVQSGYNAGDERSLDFLYSGKMMIF